MTLYPASGVPGGAGGISHTGTSGVQPTAGSTGYDSITNTPTNATYDATSGWISLVTDWTPIINLPSSVDGSTTKAGGPRTTSGIRQAFNFTNLPSGNVSLIAARSAGSPSGQVRLTSAGKIQLLQGTSAVTLTTGGGGTSTSTVTLSTGTQYRFEYFVDGAAGTQTLNIYTLTGSTPITNGVLVGPWTAATIDQYRSGILNTTTSFALKLDAPVYSNTTSRIGGASSLSVTASADSASTGIGYAVAVTGSVSNATGSPTYLWTTNSGGTFASSTSLSTTYTASGAGTHTLTLAVTDSTGTVTSNVNLTVYAILTPTPLTTAGWTLTGDGFGPSDAGWWQGTGTIEATLAPMTAPTGDFLCMIRLALPSAGSASGVPTLRDGATVVSTGNTLTQTTTAVTGQVITFLAASISGVTSAKWAAGTLVVRLVWT
jgi:hypothetical protein